MSDDEFCKMIHQWTGVDLATRVGPEPEEKESDTRKTIGELLISGKNKEDFFTLASCNDKEILKVWASQCGFDAVKCYVISLNAIKHFCGKSGR